MPAGFFKQSKAVRMNAGRFILRLLRGFVTAYGLAF